MRQISMKEERPLIYNSIDLPVKQDQVTVIYGTVYAIVNAHAVINSHFDNYRCSLHHGSTMAQWLDLRSKVCGFESHQRHCVVSLSKTH